MKKRNKLLILLLCAALITVNLPVSSSAVYAAEAASTPSKTAYADKKGLQTYYDLDNDTATADTVQKVYFGYAGDSAKTPQAWKIAGKDNEIKDGDGNTIDNIVLFADSAIKPPGGDADGEIKFDKDWDRTKSTAKDYPTAETDRAALGITYVKNNYSFIPTKVNVNHYGTSTLRSELRSMAGSTNYFTTAQQALMNKTTITTIDTYSDNGNYTTTDILYAPYGVYNRQCVTVGTNNKGGNLNDGLKVDKSSWPANTYFWLRAPHDGSGTYALEAAPNSYVYNSTVDDHYSVVPAFDLNLTNVLFASSAKKVTAAETGAKDLSGNDAMTFRWADKEGNDAKIKSTATWNEDGVNVTKGSGEGDVYLCVQGNNGGTDWIWSKKVNDVTSPIKADTIASALKTVFSSPSPPAVDLGKCKIWLETTDTNEDLTYAKQVKKLAKEPDTKTQFVEVEQLMKFDTDDSDGNPNPAKVYFGENNQRWWIAGVDEKIKDENGKKIEKNIVLFAASPLATKIQFNANYDSKTYADSWKCTYPRGSNINTVYPNHYGGSDIRNGNKGVTPENPGLVGLLESCFTDAERSLMNATTVYTQDTANTTTYSTKDKLYLAYGNLIDTFVTVGTNSADDLNNGLHVDEGYWGDDYFWLRAPGGTVTGALVAVPRNCVGSNHVDAYDSVVLPAFDLNLSSVSFASAAEAATGDGELTVKTVNDANQEGAFTLRYKSDSIGTATLSTDKKSVSISGVNNANTYLVAQNSEGAQAKKAKNGVISIEDMYPDLATFENCQIWLETTTGGLTYAKQAQTGTDGQSQGSNSNKGGQNNSNKGINTGDESNPALWITLMLIAIVGASGTAIYSKKKKAR